MELYYLFYLDQVQLMFLGNIKPKQWPECVGMTGEDAKKKITKEFPQGKIKIVKQSQVQNWENKRLDRVRIIVD